MRQNKIKLLFVGDIFIKNPKPKRLISEELLELIKKHDISSCNFEGPVIVKGATSIPKVGSYLSQHNDSPDIVISSGFNLINLANNHIYDYGDKGLKATLKSLNDVKYLGAGVNFEEAYRELVINLKGKKIAFVSYCESDFGALVEENSKRGGYAWINHPSVNHKIAELKKKTDYVIVQVHAGVENIDIPLPEWRRRYQELIEYGADLVIGHHPHVIQGYEKYNGKYIFYSLGNFYFEKDNVNTSTPGLVISVSIERNEITFSSILTQISGGKVVILKNGKYFQKLHQKIISSSYHRNIDKEVIKLWQERYLKFYQNSLKGSLYFRDINGLLLLHNIRIESHRYAAQRALSLLYEKK
jgi:poly-gamma-glutamate synthesis protein (capsule biosynthesis protein)